MTTAKQSRSRSLAILATGIIVGAALTTCATSPSADGLHNPISAAVAAAESTLSPPPAFAGVDSKGAPVVLADVAERVVPSVVNIAITKHVRARQVPMDPLFRQFFGSRGPARPQQRDQVQRGLGSGVIISRDGVILTNNHVVDGADEVDVTLADRRNYRAKVLGTDPKSDLAVIKLTETVKGLEPLPFGSSTSLRLGDVVLAVGNPFGVGKTVTMGIVSAKGRSRVGIVDYEDFIQTDAAINPGNSGGALVNTRGELVGINTAILSRSGGYQGIGFAIPADMAKPIMKSLLKDGVVKRGWLGVTIQDLDRELAEGLGLDVKRGVLISDVADGTPAARAGLERGDVITAIDGKTVTRSAQVRNRIAALGPNTEAELTIVRGKETKQVKVKLGALADSPQETAKVDSSVGGALSGLQVAGLNANMRQKLDLPDSVKNGVVVTGIAPDSPAASAGLQRGDVILQVGHHQVRSAGDFKKLAASAGDKALLLVRRGQGSMYIIVHK